MATMLFWFFAALAIAIADNPAKNTLAEMAKAIEAGEADNNFFTGDEDMDIETTPVHQLVLGCVVDKIHAMKEDPMEFQNDFQVDLAACCVPKKPNGAKPVLIPNCVEKLEPAYKIIREAKSNEDIQKATATLEAYLGHVDKHQEL